MNKESLTEEQTSQLKQAKDIKDYLHLYLGCDTLDKDNNRSYLVAAYDDGVSFVRYANEAVCISFNRDTHKLILRPLSDMTEAEGVRVGEIVIGSYDSVKFRVDKRTSPIGAFQFWKVHKEHRGYSKSLTIDDKGEIDVYDNEDDGSHSVYLNQHEVTRYLLSKGFDLFGLIEAGIAIDKTKL